MISSMNRLMAAYGRPIFLAFTLIIIVAFVGLFTPGFTDMFSGRSNPGVGTIFGETINFSDLDECARLSVVAYAVDTPPKKDDKDINLRSAYLVDHFKKMAFGTILRITAAKKLGITATPSEIAEKIKAKARFKTGKNFDLQKFDKFVRNQLLPAGYDKNDLDAAIAQQIIQEKLSKEIKDTVIVTPEEVKAYYNDMYETFDVKVATFEKADFLKEVKVTEKDLKNYFESNKKNYQTQPEFQLVIAEYAYNDFAAEAKKLVTTEAVNEFYKNNPYDSLVRQDAQAEKKNFKNALSNFKQYHNNLTSLDGSPKTYGDIEDKIDSHVISNYPTASTITKITDKLIKEKKEELALNKATAFASKIYKHLERTEKDKIAEFTKAATDSKPSKLHKKVTLKPDSKYIRGIGSQPKLVEKAQKLSKANRLSDGIKGNNSAYICYLIDKTPSKQAEFAQVKQDVTNDYKDQQALLLAREKAKNAAVKVSAAIEKGKSLKELEKITKFTKVPPFKGMYPPYTQNGRMISELAETMPQGSISAVKDTDKGALFVYLVKRELPKAADFDKDKKSIETQYSRIKEMSSVQAFYSWLDDNSLNKLEEKR